MHNEEKLKEVLYHLPRPLTYENWKLMARGKVPDYGVMAKGLLSGNYTFYDVKAKPVSVDYLISLYDRLQEEQSKGTYHHAFNGYFRTDDPDFNVLSNELVWRAKERR